MEHLIDSNDLVFRFSKAIFAIKMMLGKYPLLLALSCCLSELLMAAVESQFDHSAWLDPSENYRLHWTVDHKDKSITFAAEVKTTGWIGFGISKGLTGTMKGSDIAIGWIDNTGKGHITVGWLYVI